MKLCTHKQLSITQLHGWAMRCQYFEYFSENWPCYKPECHFLYWPNLYIIPCPVWSDRNVMAHVVVYVINGIKMTMSNGTGNTVCCCITLLIVILTPFITFISPFLGVMPTSHSTIHSYYMIGRMIWLLMIISYMQPWQLNSKLYWMCPTYVTNTMHHNPFQYNKSLQD